MVKMIENWVVLKGTVIAVSESSLLNFDTVKVAVNEVKNHEDFPNLIGRPDQQELEIKITSAKVALLHLKPGDEISGIVRMAGPNQFFFAEDSITLL